MPLNSWCEKWLEKENCRWSNTYYYYVLSVTTNSIRRKHLHQTCPIYLTTSRYLTIRSIADTKKTSMSFLPSVRRPHPSLKPTLTTHHHQTQLRHASLLRRPKRPYTFTQLVTLSDGSTFLHRTTSPAPLYKSTKDTRNNPLWNPSSQRLLNIEEDEAGKLRAFREKFGRGWDAERMDRGEEKGDSLVDLISGRVGAGGKKKKKEGGE